LWSWWRILAALFGFRRGGRRAFATRRLDGAFLLYFRLFGAADNTERQHAQNQHGAKNTFHLSKTFPVERNGDDTSIARRDWLVNYVTVQNLRLFLAAP
jgi:hypothetical protein